MRGIRRIVSGLLAVCMVTSILPQSAWATDATEVNESVVPESTNTATVETIISEPVCSGAIDCVAQIHEVNCEKKLIEEKATADELAVATVAALIDNLPSLENIKSKTLADQQEDYNLVQAAYDAYENLTDEQKSLMSSAEETFGAYFDYFNSLTAPVATSGTCGDNLTWTLDDNGTLTVSGTGDMYEYSYENDNIGSHPWHSWKWDIKTVIIEDGVTSVGKCAFWNIPYLTEVTIGDDVSYIGDQAFCECSKLASIHLGKNLQSSGNSAFFGCDSLANVYVSDFKSWCEIDKNFHAEYGNPLGDWSRATVERDVTLYIDGIAIKGDLVIPDGITKISSYTFTDCHEITSVSFPEGLNYIGSAFSGCENLTSVSIPTTLTELGGFSRCGFTEFVVPEWVTSVKAGAFAGCANLESVQFPMSLKKLGNTSFSGCTALRNVVLPTAVTSLGDKVFYNCDSLTEISIPDSVQTIGSSAFAECDNIETVTLPSGLTAIADAMFKNCVVLRSISIPSKVSAIGANSFSGCTSLTNVDLPEGLLSIGVSVFKGSSAIADMKLPDSVTTIGNSAFYNLSQWQNPSIPASAITIGSNAYYSCTGLASAELPNSVTSVGANAFYNCTGINTASLSAGMDTVNASIFRGCTGLKTVTIPDNITTISTSMFQGCTGLESITLPDSITTISEKAFSGCSALTRVDFLGDVPTIDTTAFSGVTATCYYPEGNETYTAEVTTADYGGDLVWTYEGAEVEDDFYKCGENITWSLADGVLTLTGEGEMYDYSIDDYNYAPWYESRSSISSIVIGEGITGLGDCAFYACTSAKSVSMPDTLISIGDRVFEQAGFTTVTIPEGVSDVGSRVFYDCNSLKTAYLPDSMTLIPSYMFYGCEYLNTVDLPEMITIIGEYAFNCCYGLNSMVLPEGLTRIEKNAFSMCGCSYLYGGYYPCYNFTSISLPTTLKYIGSGAFNCCNVLNNVVIPAGIEYIGDGAFNYCMGLSTVTFKWNVPEFDITLFSGWLSGRQVDPTCYYPSNNEAWTSDLLQDYGGKPTWVGIEMEEPEEGTGGAAGEGSGEEDPDVGGGETGGGTDSDDNETEGGNTGGGNESGENSGGSGSGGNESGDGSGTGSSGDHSHSYESVVTSPTCTADGYTTYTCSSCGDSYVDDYVDATGHTEVVDDAVAPTCTETGLTAGSHCSVCGETFVEQEVIPSNGHTKVSVIEQVDATCEADGVKAHYFCDVCDTYYGIRSTEDEKILSDLIGNAGALAAWKTADGKINKLPHTNEIVPAEAPTCTDTGIIEHWKCSFCGKLYADESGINEITDVTVDIDPDAHDWNNGEITANPTCTKVGVKTFTCQHNASHIYTEDVEIDANAHTYGDLIPAKAEVHTKTELKPAVAAHYLCGCGAYFTENKVETTLEELNGETPKHSYTSVVTTDPTCTKTGVETFTCTCGDSYIEDVAIDTNAHNWDEGKVTTPPTCSKVGVKTYTCQHNAKHTYIEDVAIEKNAHKWGETVYTWNADGKACVSSRTCLHNGEHTETAKATITSAVKMEPGCTSLGETTYTATFKVDWAETQSKDIFDIPVKGHTMKETTAKVEPDCENEGQEPIFTCVNGCGHTEGGKSIEALGHKEAVDKAVDPTCTETGLTEGKHCPVCNEVLVVQETVKAKGHTEVVDEAVEATCTKTGLTEGKHCSVCDEILVVQTVVAAKGHTAVIDEAVAPTCTATGLTEGKHCSVCKEVLVEQEIVKALGHNYKETVVEPTCTETGKTTFTCSRCDDEYFTTVPAKGHTEVIDKAVDSTCTKTGLTEGKHCSVCDEVLVEQEVVAALGHTEVVDKAVDPTCTETGLTEGKHCSVCNEVLVAQETVKAKGHTEVIDEAVAPTCTATGLTEGKHCSICKEVLVEQEIVKALGHNYKETVVEPTCTETGRTTYSCTRCDDAYFTTAPALGHDWSEWDTVDATCTVDGSKTRSCKRNGCNETETEAISATGEHIYDQEIADAKYLVSEATSTTPAVYRKSCKCGAAGEETFTAGELKVPEFKDVPEDAYYYDPVIWAVENKITNGVGDGTVFEPDSSCTRAHVATFLWRAAGCPTPERTDMPFTDVPADDYFSTAVIWAAENGITTGTGDGTTFEPHATCTRGQIVTFLRRYLKGTPSSNENPFKDVPDGEYYTNAVLWAVEKGITNGVGDGTLFEPNNTCTRGMIVTFLYRALNQNR